MSQGWFLSDEELSHLTPDELEAYELALQGLVGGWQLTPKQQLAEDLTRTCFEVGYGGAAGGGKSDWGLYHVDKLSREIPRHRSLVLRTQREELKRSLIPRSLEKFDFNVARYYPAEHVWKYDNHSLIEFAYLDKDEDVYHYKSAEYDCIFIDEATEMSEFAYNYIKSRCRTPTWKRSAGAWPHVILATNPGGRGHGWFKRNFVEATNHGEKLAERTYKDPMTGRELTGSDGKPITRHIAFVPAYVWDNPYMPDEYRLNLLELDEIEMRQLLYGDWDAFSGQFFTEWNRAIHVVRPFVIPESWTRVRGIDYGFRAPYCCLWGAVDWDNDLWLYREHYQAGLTAEEQASGIVERSKMAVGESMAPEKIRWTNADPSMFNRTGSGRSIAQIYHDNGVRLRPAKNDRKAGWDEFRQYLKPRDPQYDENEGREVVRARLRIFPGCENLIRTLPDAIFDTRSGHAKVDDLDTTGEDHALDAARYLMMGFVRPPGKDARRQERTLDEQVWDEFAELADAAERRYRRGGGGESHPVLGRV